MHTYLYFSFLHEGVNSVFNCKLKWLDDVPSWGDFTLWKMFILLGICFKL